MIVTPVRSQWNNSPVWFQWALHEIGVHEQGNNSGPRLAQYRELAKCGVDHDPWCAIFANAAFEVNGLPGTASALARSFARSPYFKPMEKPALGAVVVFWRGWKGGDRGHVGFYRGESDDYIYTLGGNEADQVEIAPMAKYGHSFGLLGYYWPSRVPLPQVMGTIPIRYGQPLTVSSVV